MVINYRGYEVELKTTRSVCPSFYDDLDLVVKHAHKKYPDHKIMALGDSLGGILLGGYLAQEKEDCIISYAMLISAPMNLSNTMKYLDKGLTSVILNRFFTTKYKRYFKK